VIFQFFQDGGRPPSWICDARVWTTHEGLLVVFIIVQNLVGIDRVVSIICKFLAHVNSGSRSLNAVVRPSVVCRLCVTFVHPTQPAEIFDNVSNFLCRLVPWPSVDIHGKFYGGRSKGSPPYGEREVNARGVSKYSDFGHIEGYISKTVQDRRYVSINH